MGEKRIHPRLDLPLQAELLVEGSKRRATLENLSAGGAGLRMTEQLAPGTRVDEIDFTLPANGKSSGFHVATKAEIVHAEPVPQPDGDGGYAAGLRFIDLPENQFRGIQKFIFERLTKGSPDSSEIPLERRRVTLERPVSIRFERFDEFVNQMAENISLGGMFIRTDAPKSPGTVFSFKFQLGDDFSLVEGEAEVVWTRHKSLGPTQHAGMGIRFLDLDERSRNTILSLVKKKATGAAAKKPTPKLRVAAVMPKSASPASATSISSRQAARTKPATSASGDTSDPRIGKLRHELGRRTRAYEARIAALEKRIEELTAKRVEQTAGMGDSEAARPATALVEFEETRSRVELEQVGSGEHLQTANQQIQKLRQELEGLTAEIEADRRKRASLENKLLAVEQALRGTERERDEFSSRLAESAESRRKLQAELDAIEAGEEGEGEEDLRRELAEALDRNRTFEERMAVALRDRDEALGKLTLVSTTESSVRKVTEDAERERQDLLSTLGQAQDQLARAEKVHEDRLAELREEIEEAGRVAEEMRLLAKDEEAARLEAESRLDHVQAELELERTERTSIGEQLEKELRTALSRASELEEELVHLEASLEDAARRRQDHEEALARTEDEFENMRAEQEELVAGFRTETQEAVTAAADLAAAREALEASLKDSEGKRGRLEETVTATREELERAVQERDAVESELREEIEKARSHAAELEARMTDVDASLESATRARDELEEALGESRAEVERLVGELEEKQAASREEVDAAVSAREALELQVIQLDASLEDAARGRQEIESALARAEEELDQVRAEHEELVAGLRAEAQEAGSAVGELERVVEERQAVESELRQELEATLAGKGELEEALARMRSELDGVQAEYDEKLAELRAEAEQTASTLTELRTSSEEQKASLETSERERRELEMSLSESRVEFEQLAEERGTIETEHRERIVALEALLQEAERKHDEVRNRALEAEAKLQDQSQASRETEETLRGEIKEMRTEGERLGQDRDEAQDRVNALEIELDKVQTALSEQQTSSREMETELRQELGEAFGLKGRFEDRTKELDELLLAERERLDSMTGELEQSVEARNALQAEKVTLQSVVHGLKSELEDKLGRTPAEIEELMDQAVAAGERAPRRRWLRAAGLVGVGLLTGALLGGPASQFLPADLNPGSWFGARTVATSESVGLVQEATGVSSDRSGASAAEEAAGSLASGVGAELPVASVTEERGTPREAPYPSPANVVTAWAEAWSGQRVDDYLSFYSRSFVPANGADRSAWEAQRRDRVSSPASIEVSLGEIAERKLNDERVSVTFEQAYRAGSYSDRVMKTLVLVREAGTWKILSEVSEVLE